MVSNTLTGPGKKKKAKGKKGTKSKSNDHLNKNTDVQDTLQDPLTQGTDQSNETENDNENDSDIVSDTEKTEDVDKGDSGKGDPSDDGTGSGSPDSGSGGPSGSGDPKGGGDPKGDGSGDGDSKGGGGGGGGAPSGGGDGPKKGGGGGAQGKTGAGNVSKDKSKVKGKAKKGQGSGGSESVTGGGGIESLGGGGGGGGGGGIEGVSVSPLSPPNAPVMFNENNLLQDPSLDKVLVMGTGLGIIGHQAQLATQASQLTATIGNANNLIAQTATTLTGISSADASNLKGGLNQLWNATTNSLGLTFGLISEQVEGETEAVKQAAAKALAAANKQVEDVTAKAISDEKTAFDAAHGLLTQGKAQWEGDYKSTVKAQAQKVRDMGKAYETLVKTKESGHRSIFKAKGATGSAADAIPLAQERAKADAYKAYQPEFGKYAKLAAMFLDNMAEKAVDLSDKLMAPTLDDLYPLADENKKTMEASAKKLQAQIDEETKGFEKSSYAIQKDQVDALKTGEEDATAQVDEAAASLEESTDTTVNALNQEQALVAEKVQATQNDTLKAADEVGRSLKGTPDAMHFEKGKRELIDDMQRDSNEVATVMAADQQRTMSFVRGQHDTQQSVIKSASDEHMTQVTKAGQSTVATMQAAGSNVGSQIDSLMGQSDKTYKTLGKATADKATETGETVDTTSKDYQTQLLAQLEDYVTGVDQQMQQLVGAADSSAQSASKAAEATQKKALHDRADNIYKAIDGWGTDESTLIKNMSGLTWSEAKYTADHFSSLHESGISLRQAIIDDTSPGDNVREACLAYLTGDQKTGAKFALKYASEGIWRIFGSDMDLANSVMSSMSEESRTELLNDPEFPAIGENLTRPRMQLSPAAMILSPGLAAGSAFFGNSKYELDTFAALSDKTKTLEQAKEDVEVINLAKAFDTDSMNPFKQGTDEAQVFAILGKLEGEALEKFKAKFEKYKGVSLEDEIKDEFQGFFEEDLEYKRAMALCNGDKGKADAYALELSLQDEKEKEVFTQLEDPNLSSDDWLANKKANQSRAELNQNYEKNTGSTISDDINTHLADEGENATDIAQSLLLGQDADPRHLLAYAIIGAGTHEDYAQKAIKQLLTNVQKLQKAEQEKPNGDPAGVGLREWNKLKYWFEKEHGITDLERYLGVGDFLFSKNDGFGQELDGQEKQDFNDILMQITADPNSVKDTYARLKQQWEWYRGKGSSGFGNTVVDMYSDSGGDLDHKLTVLDELMETPARADGKGNWYDTSTGKADKQTAEWAKFDKYATLLDEMAGIYKDQRDTLVDGICSVITTVAAVIATIVTMGGAAAIWAVAITAAAAAMAITVKAAVKGSSYGANEALADVGKAAAEIVTSLVTLGMASGKFKAVGKFFEGLAEANIGKQMLGEMLKSAATEIPAALIDPATWADEDKLLALLGSLTFKVGVGSVGGVLNEKAMDGFEGTAGKFMKSISESVVEVSSDLSALQGDNWAMDVMTGSIKKFGNKYIGGKMASNAANKLNEKTSLSPKDLERFQNMSKDAAEAISKKLLPQHHIQAYKAAPLKVPEPSFTGAQLDLFDHKKAKAVGGKKENKNPEVNPQSAVKPETDPNQLTMDFGSEDSESTVQTPKKIKTVSSVKEKAKSVQQNQVKTQGVPTVLQDVSAPGVAEKLQKIHGIGKALSAAIVDHGGPFESPADLQAVHRNIGEKLAIKIWEEI